MMKKTVLPNGARLVCEELPHTRSVAFGVWVGTGSRCEREQLSGVSHFIEHMLFKGTEKRSARQIAEELDAVGGQLNAFTGREATCYYARVLAEDAPVAVDVLTDMFFHSVFAPEEMEKEKQVILEEIKMCEDAPDDLVMDLFTENLWQGHALGRSILGRASALSGLTRADITGYMHSHYTPERVVIAVAGNIRAGELAEKFAPFAALSRPPAPPRPRPPAAAAVPRQYAQEIAEHNKVVGGAALDR
ncbi:MAG: insulinase family protein, partial [Gracilibacteraceae bacterium]|nr:insulinase family protein [Gracilibacteraceae bacterium]